MQSPPEFLKSYATSNMPINLTTYLTHTPVLPTLHFSFYMKRGF